MSEKITLTRQELEDIIENATTRALTRIGLEDSSAAKDIREIRGLVDAWRVARRTVWKTVFQSITTVTLMLLAAGILVKVKGG